jgi:hypothetical protein
MIFKEIFESLTYSIQYVKYKSTWLERERNLGNDEEQGTSVGPQLPAPVTRTTTRIAFGVERREEGRKRKERGRKKEVGGGLLSRIICSCTTKGHATHDGLSVSHATAVGATRSRHMAWHD